MLSAPPRTHLVGCGRLGLTLGRLFTERGWIEPGDVVTRSLEGARRAVEFIGAGRAVARVEDLGKRDLGRDELGNEDPRRADLVFVWTPDADLARAAEEITRSTLQLEGVAIVHASGALSSEVLAPLRARGASVASVHPIRSFAAPERLDAGLEGVVCGAEGDAEALALVLPIFEAAGARSVSIRADAKPVYHAAAVLACNHVVGLIESAARVYAAAGLEREIAMKALEPLVRGTLDNVFARGTAGALSGPIVRGEAELISTQLDRIDAVSKTLGDVYRALALQTLPLARETPGADAERLDAVEQVLERGSREA